MYRQNWSLMTKQYNYLDTRFSNPYANGSAAATLTIFLEGAVMCPLCVLIFIGYRYVLPRNRKNKRSKASVVWIYCLEFVVCLCQSLGTYFFYGAEFILLLTGQKTHMPYAQSAESLDFNIWECFYFWFGTVLMVMIWIFVPLILIRRAYRQLMSLVDDKMKRS